MKRGIYLAALAVIVLVCTLFCTAPRGAFSESDLSSAIRECIRAHRDSIDIESYGVTPEEANNVFFRVFYEHPEFFYCNSRVRTSYIESKNIAVGMEMDYNMSAAEAITASGRFRAEIDRIVALVPAELPPEEKVLWLNDYMVSNYQYVTGDSEIHDAYNFLMKKEGVCEAYTLAMMALLDGVGIGSTYISYGNFEAESHAWLAVNINGRMYNLDVTWNDPVVKATGDGGRTYGNMNTHRYLLVSDSLMAELGHRTGDNYGEKIACSSTDLDGAFWRYADDPMVYLKGRWHYITDEGIVSCESGGSGRTVTPIEGARWYVQGTSGSYWTGVYSGIGVYGNGIYFNTPRGVSVLEPDSGEITEVFSYDGVEQIYFSRIPAGSSRMTLYIDDAPNTSTFETVVIDLSTLGAAVPDVTSDEGEDTVVQPTERPTDEPLMTEAPTETGPELTPLTSPASYSADEGAEGDDRGNVSSTSRVPWYTAVFGLLIVAVLLLKGKIRD